MIKESKESKTKRIIFICWFAISMICMSAVKDNNIRLIIAGQYFFLHGYINLLQDRFRFNIGYIASFIGLIMILYGIVKSGYISIGFDDIEHIIYIGLNLYIAISGVLYLIWYIVDQIKVKNHDIVSVTLNKEKNGEVHTYSYEYNKIEYKLETSLKKDIEFIKNKKKIDISTYDPSVILGKKDYIHIIVIIGVIASITLIILALI